MQNKGIKISTSLPSIAKTNYLSILKKIEDDLKRWKHLPASVPARISVIKMNVLPRINFISSMIPLAPPVRYWKKLDSLVRSYVWNSKRPSIKWSALQFKKSDGGWACPNFKLYHWAFILRNLSYWLEEDRVTSWKKIEQEILINIY